MPPFHRFHPLKRRSLPEYAVRPGEGIGPVRVGINRDEVARALTAAQVDDLPFGDPFRVRFHDDEVVAIELAGLGPDAQSQGLDRGFTALLNGVDVFRTPAAQVVAAAGHPPVQEDETYAFPRLGLRLWRQEGDEEEPPAPCFESVLVERPQAAAPPPRPAERRTARAGGRRRR